MSVTVGKVAGVYVDLSKLKTAIEKKGIIGLGQRGFAARHHLDQAGLSRRLRGLEKIRFPRPHPEGCVYFEGPFETAIEDECGNRGISLDYFALPAVGAVPTGSGYVPPSVAPTPKPVPEPDEYPLEDMQKVANIVRDGTEAGEVSMTFSMRALIRIGFAYAIFKEDANLSHWPALSTAFWVTKVYPADDEGRRFLLEAYQRIFAKEATPPHEGKLLPFREDQHPGEVMVKILANRGYPVYSFGKTGEGKTYANERVARELSSTGRYHRFQGDRDKTAADFVGDLGSNAGTTHRVDGPLPAARKNGEPLIVDEICICDPSVLMCLQAVLEGADLYITGSYYAIVEAANGHIILVTDNTRGLGESVEYVGCHAINESTRDRFYFVEFGRMEPQQERKIVASELDADLPAKLAG